MGRMKGTPRILIHHSWSLNMGDAAMLITLVRMLRRMSPEARITALVSHPAFSRERCIRAELDGWPWPVGGSEAGSPLGMLSYPFIFLGNLLSAAAYRIAKARIFVFNGRYSGPLSRFFDCDVVISPGGDFISPRYCFMTTFGDFLMSRILGKKLIICAQTIGPFEGLLDGRLAAAVLGLADLIIVREEESARRLASIGLRDVHVDYRPGLCLPCAAAARRKKDRENGREDYNLREKATGRAAAAFRILCEDGRTAGEGNRLRHRLHAERQV